MEITAEYARSRLSYDPGTGEFMWRLTKSPRVKPGDRAGTTGPDGYRAIMVGGRIYKAHRLAWLIATGSWPTAQIDHINGNRTDNRLCNLRECTNAQNAQNVRRPRANSTSGFIGVTQRRGKRFVAQISVDGKVFHVGTCDTPQEAAKLYLDKKREMHPFGNL